MFLLQALLFLLTAGMLAAGDKLMEQCSKEAGVPMDEVEKFTTAMDEVIMSNGTLPAVSQSMGCFIACTFKKTKMMKEDGTMVLPERMKSMVDCYNEVKETDICQRSVKMLECRIGMM